MKFRINSSTAVLAAALVSVLAVPMFAGTRWKTLYTSQNLSNHFISAECSPGDPTTNCPCTTADVALVVHENYGEVISNARLTNVFVNAIGYSRIQDTYPDGQSIGLDVLRYGAEFRLKDIPTPDVARTHNAQATHLMMQMWDGTNRIWQANKMALEATIFWPLNPWQTNDFGKIYAYTTVSGALEYIDTGLRLPVDTNWHSLEFVADFAHGKFVSVTADGQVTNLDQLAIARLYRPTWGTELVYQITQESCATYPGPGYSNTICWTTEYRNVRFDRLDTSLAGAIGTNGQYDIRWLTEPFLDYVVSSSSNMTSWFPDSSVITGDGTLYYHSVTVTNPGPSFYRLDVVQ